jgi:lantibiotic modifying enzyme
MESGIKTNQVLQAAEKTSPGGLLKSSGDEIMNPGFFQGISGIGYAMLRQAYPQKFPSILIFE